MRSQVGPHIVGQTSRSYCSPALGWSYASARGLLPPTLGGTRTHVHALLHQSFGHTPALLRIASGARRQPLRLGDACLPQFADRCSGVRRWFCRSHITLQYYVCVAPRRLRALGTVASSGASCVIYSHRRYGRLRTARRRYNKVVGCQLVPLARTAASAVQCVPRVRHPSAALLRRRDVASGCCGPLCCGLLRAHRHPRLGPACPLRYVPAQLPPHTCSALYAG